MSDFKVCNVCQYPGTFDNTLEFRQIPSNIRKFSEQKFTVWRCSSCNSLHSKELVNLNSYYEDYIAEKLVFNYFLWCGYYNRLKLLRKYGFNKEHSLLDYGCNQGLFLLFLKQRGYQNIFGYDPYVPKYSQQEILQGKYDFITGYDVIEHVDEPSDFLNHLVSCLSKDGLLILGTPNADEIQLSYPESPELHQPYHRHILSEQALVNLAFSKNLKAIHFEKRWYLDTLLPLVNSLFILNYIQNTGNVIDVLVESIQWQILLIYPLLIFYGFVGYFFRWQGNMTVVFR